MNALSMMDPAIKIEFIQANDLSFEVYSCGTGDKLALCLHGFPEHAFSWRYQIPLLAQLGYKVWAPNLRGYGKSSKPQEVKNYSIEHLLADVAGLIDAAQCSSVHLIAHDWGAIIAWAFAMRKIRPLEKLTILNCPHPGPAGREFKTNPAQRRKSWYMTFFQLPWIPEWVLGRKNYRPVSGMIYSSACDKSKFPPEVLAVYQQNAAQPGALTAMLNYYRAAIRGGGFLRQRKLGYPVMDTPTLMIWGEEDVAICKEMSYGTERWVKDLTIRYLPGVSHWVQQEAPDKVNKILTAWIKEEQIPEFTPP